MRKVGIIGALNMEVETLKEQMEQVKIEQISRMTFYSGLLWGCEAVVAVSGVGKVNAAMCAQTMILKYAPDIIINTGVAGGHSSLNVCDTVIASQVVQHDCDSTSLGDPIGLIAGVDSVYIPCAESVVNGLIAAAERLGRTYYTGVVASGDQFIASREKAAWISDTFDAVAYEMEGGSIGQVCCLNSVDFGVVRIISDNGNEEAPGSFEQFAEIAAEKSMALLKEFLTEVKA